MTATIGNDLALQGGDGKPLILYRNVFRRADATVTASSENTTFEASNAYDWKPSTSWLPDDGAATLTCVLPEAVAADCLAIFGSNHHQNAGHVKLEYSQDGGSTWVLACEQTVGAAVREIIWLRFTKVYAQRWRFTTTSTPASNIPVLCVGELLVMEEGFLPGSIPPRWARNTVSMINRSVDGVYLGRTNRRYGTLPSFTTAPLSWPWIDVNWLPWMIHAEKKPFFLCPNYGPHVGARGTALVWSRVQGGGLGIDPPRDVGAGFATLMMRLEGQSGEQQEEIDDA